MKTLPDLVASPRYFKPTRFEQWWYRRAVRLGTIKPYQQVPRTAAWGVWFIAETIRRVIALSSAHADGCEFEFDLMTNEVYPLCTRLRRLFGLPTRPGIWIEDFERGQRQCPNTPSAA